MISIQAAFRRCGTVGTLSLSRSTWNVKVSSYNLRSLLWAGGATASNKVIEALVGRFARNRFITLEGYLMSMTRLHLAHGKYLSFHLTFQLKLNAILNDSICFYFAERFHSLDAKAKANPLTLEEMILMTIYS